MDRFSELKAFTAVIEAGSFSSAARDLAQSRSSVNRLVIALETRLGVQLLNRTTRSVSPTSSGQALYERAKQLLADFEEMERNLASSVDEPIGKLRVSAPPRFGLSNFSTLFVEFQQAFPKVQVEVVYDTRLVDPVSEGYDVLLRIAPPDETTGFVDHRIFSIDYGLCAAPSYLKAHGAPDAASDLRAHAILFQGHREAPPVMTLSDKSGTANVRVQPVMISNEMITVYHAALAGIGITALPLMDVRHDLEAGRLIRVLPESTTPARVLQVVYPPSRHLSPKVRSFTDFVSAWCDRRQSAPPQEP